MGRKRADVWAEYDVDDKDTAFKVKRVRCRHCGREFTAHANRMKEHLKLCPQYKEAIYKGIVRPIDLSSSHYDMQRTQNKSTVYSLVSGQDIVCRTVFKMGIVGAGFGATMGPLHIVAATMGRRAKLVCGCFSSDVNKGKASGGQYNIQRSRIYNTYEEMFQRESELPKQERMDFVCIATPTSTHFEIASLALRLGFHVMCESPLCLSDAEAIKLQEQASEKNLILATSYPYAYYSMLRYARDIIESNTIGEVISVRVNYLQNAGLLERDLNTWRMNTAQAGVSYCFSDLGLQAFQLARYITQLTPNRLSACLARSYSGRLMDDNGTVLIKMKEGAICHISVSKMSMMHDNDIEIEVDGNVGSLHWDLTHCNQLVLQRAHMSKQVLTPDSPFIIDHLRSRYSRMPVGHSEGFNDAMANMYDSFFDELESVLRKELHFGKHSHFTGITDGIEGVLFLNRAMESSQRGSLWTDVPSIPVVDLNTTAVPSQFMPLQQSLQGFSSGIHVLNPPTSVSSFPIINSLPNEIRSMNIGVIPTGVGDDSIPNAQSPSIVAEQPYIVCLNNHM